MKLNTIVQRHYDLHRRVTDDEVQAEVESIQRKGLAFLCDRQRHLAFAIESNSNIKFRSGLTNK